MDPADGKELREVADRVQQLAKNVRAEVTLGQRLIRFAQGALPGALTKATQPRELGYDRQIGRAHV